MTNFTKTKGLLILALVMLSITTFTTHAEARGIGPRNFIHGITITLHHGQHYYFNGPPDGQNGARDIPGHSWIRIGRNRYLGKHVNTGPFGAPNWWSSDGDDGELLFVMEAIIDNWSEALALKYYARGFIHYTELVNVETGTKHPTKVAWLKHVAVKPFEMDGPGPLAFLDIDSYTVMPGVDFSLGPNWDIPYVPTTQ